MKAAPSAVGATASTTNYFEQSGPQQTIKRLRSLECEGDSFLGSWSGGAIKAHELDLGAGEVIAQGNHGVVYKGTCRGSTVAIKVLRTQTMRMNKKQLEALQREADIMRELRHPSLLLLMGVCADEGRLAIVTEYVAGRDLSAIVHDSAVQMSVRQQLTIAKGIAQGMTWLHCLKPEPIIHRDLKPANVLVTPEGNVKVCDFGLSCVKEVYDAEAPPRDTVTGTAIYLAPEVLEGMPASEASDVYAFGVLLWELFTRTKPFREIDNPRKLHQAIVDQRQRPPLTDAIPEAVANLIKACWHHDRLARPSFGQVLQTLDAAVVEVSLSHAEARNFWRSLRPQDGQKYPWAVSWDRFIEAFHRYARPKLPLKLFAHSTEAKCARLLLAVQNVDVTRSRDRQEWIVLLEHFARFTHLFGPFRPTILSDFNALCQTRCFHGTIEAKEAERRLAAGKKKKGYLVRLSAKDPSSVTISRWEKGKVRHVRVTRSDEWFHVPLGKEVHRYADLLSFLASPLATKSGRGALGLRKVCDRDSDFAAIHDEAEGAYQGAADSDDDWNGYDEDAIILVDDKAARRRTCPPGQIARP